MTTAYIPPQNINEWVIDTPNGELYKLIVFSDRTVCSASGRYAHSSGASFCTWQEFATGKMNHAVEKNMGTEILKTSVAFVKNLLLR